jgi:hypothetical protein
VPVTVHGRCSVAQLVQPTSPSAAEPIRPPSRSDRAGRMSASAASHAAMGHGDSDTGQSGESPPIDLSGSMTARRCDCPAHLAISPPRHIGAELGQRIGLLCPDAVAMIAR